MKQLIVLMATLPILLILLMQITQSQVLASNMKAIEYACIEAEHEASLTGYFSDDLKESLKETIASRFKIEPESVLMEATDIDNIKYKEQEYDSSNLITYKIEFTIPKVMAGHKFFGIRDEDNKADIVIERNLMSEKLLP